MSPQRPKELTPGTVYSRTDRFIYPPNNVKHEIITAGGIKRGSAYTRNPGSDFNSTSFTVYCYGDSLLTEGGVNVYPRRLPSHWKVFNEGEYGEAAIAGWSRVVSDTRNMAPGTVVAMMWGTNDVASPFYETVKISGMSMEDYVLTKLIFAVDTCIQRNLVPIFMLPPPYGHQFEGYELYNSRLEGYEGVFSLAAAKREIRFISVYREFLNFGNYHTLVDGGGVHLSPAGHQFIADLVVDSLKNG